MKLLEAEETEQEGAIDGNGKSALKTKWKFLNNISDLNSLLAAARSALVCGCGIWLLLIYFALASPSVFPLPLE